MSLHIKLIANLPWFRKKNLYKIILKTYRPSRWRETKNFLLFFPSSSPFLPLLFSFSSSFSLSFSSPLLFSFPFLSAEFARSNGDGSAARGFYSRLKSPYGMATCVELRSSRHSIWRLGPSRHSVCRRRLETLSRRTVRRRRLETFNVALRLGDLSKSPNRTATSDYFCKKKLSGIISVFPNKK